MRQAMKKKKANLANFERRRRQLYIYSLVLDKQFLQSDVQTPDTQNKNNKNFRLNWFSFFLRYAVEFSHCGEQLIYGRFHCIEGQTQLNWFAQ